MESIAEKEALACLRILVAIARADGTVHNDERKSLAAARAGCHIHLDEVIERAEQFANRHVVMMHFSQLYRPDEIPGILDARLPPELRRRIVPFIPGSAHWPG